MKFLTDKDFINLENVGITLSDNIVSNQHPMTGPSQDFSAKNKENVMDYFKFFQKNKLLTHQIYFQLKKPYILFNKKKLNHVQVLADIEQFLGRTLLKKHRIIMHFDKNKH